MLDTPAEQVLRWTLPTPPPPSLEPSSISLGSPLGPSTHSDCHPHTSWAPNPLNSPVSQLSLTTAQSCLCPRVGIEMAPTSTRINTSYSPAKREGRLLPSGSSNFIPPPFKTLKTPLSQVRDDLISFRQLMSGPPAHLCETRCDTRTGSEGSSSEESS